MITIVVAEAEDMSTIQDIALRVWPVTYGKILAKEQLEYMLASFYSMEALLKNGAEGQYFILAREGDLVLGFASFEHFEQDKKTKIHKLYLLAESQGKGVGKLLVDYIATNALQNQSTILGLNVNRYNKALGFYQKLGFTITKQEDIPIGNGYLMEDYVLERPL